MVPSVRLTFSGRHRPGRQNRTITVLRDDHLIAVSRIACEIREGIHRRSPPTRSCHRALAHHTLSSLWIHSVDLLRLVREAVGVVAVRDLRRGLLLRLNLNLNQSDRAQAGFRHRLASVGQIVHEFDIAARLAPISL